MSDLAELIQRMRLMEQWQKGNGGRGAEQRLQTVEDRTQSIERNCCAELCQENAVDIEDLQHRMIEAEHIQEGFVTAESMNEVMEKAKEGFIKALRAERKKATEILKALAPYFAAACALVAAFFIK